MSARTLVVVGSGPGIGVQTAALFASRGFNVALISRNAVRLRSDAATVGTAGPGSTVKTYSVDVGTHQELKKTLDRVQHDLGPPEVVVFNAARVAESTIGNEPPEAILQDFKIMNVGLYVTASWALPLLAAKAVRTDDIDAHPSFFMTGGGIWQHASPKHISLSMQKAAQVNLANSLEQAAGPQGIHVATVSVNGIVDDSNEVINAKNVAAKYWELYQQDKPQWQSMVDVGDREALRP